MLEKGNLYTVLYWQERSTDFGGRCQCQYNSYVKNSKLCNNLTYKEFIATQKLTFISSSASWCCVSKAAACMLSHWAHSVNASLFLLLSVSVGCFFFCKLVFLCVVWIWWFLLCHVVWKGQLLWRNHLGS